MARKHKKHKSEREAKERQDEEDEKPGLKLVLKVAPSEPPAPEPAPPSEEPEHHHKHKHKKKKKKKSSDKDKHRQHEHGKKRKFEEEETQSLPPPSVAPSPKPETPQSSKAGSQPTDDDTLEDVEESQSLPLPVLQETSKSRTAIGSLQTPFTKLLLHVHRLLQKRDSQGFFAFPVTDNIAPLYSQIISKPMDYSTMKVKVQNGEYNTFTEYKADFQLMCTNCMTYNRPETIFYKAAKKLLASGSKLLTKEGITRVKTALPFGDQVTEHDLGLDLDESIDIETVEENANSKVIEQLAAKPVEELEPVADDMTPEEILEQAEAAAKGAADRLTLRNPKGKIGFLRRRKDGSTTLNIINPDNSGIVGEKEKIVNLGKLTGKLQTGYGSIAGFKEDKRNTAKPVNYLYYGPYSSYAPVYDSSFATVPKEESDMLLSTYGDETGVQYAKSMQHFVEDAGDFAIKMVDNILDIITGGDHSKTVQILKQKEKEKEEKDLLEDAEGRHKDKSGKEAVNPDSVKSLEDTGIDMSFLDTFAEKEPPSSVQEQLDHTAGLLKELQETQYKRLSTKPPAHLAHVQGPAESEIQIAEKVSEGLKSLTKQVGPKEVVPMSNIRSALGIETVSSSTGGEEQPPEVMEID